MDRVARLDEIGRGLGVTTTQLALASCLRPSSIASVIVGATTPLQLRENIAAASVHLDTATLARVDALFPAGE